MSVFQSATNNLFFGLRLPDTALEFQERFKSQLKISAIDGDSVDMVFIEGRDKPWDSTQPRGIEYWKTLH